MKNFISIIVLALVSFNALHAQVDAFPCDEPGSVATHKIATQTTTQLTYTAGLAVDGNIGTTSRTTDGQNRWLELDLGAAYNLKQVVIYYPSGEAMSNYYLLFSELPFSSQDLSQQLSSTNVNYYHVSGQLSSGQALPLSLGKNARYVRIQRGGSGTVVVSEIRITGTGGSEEICGNGIDDNCDGKADCDDSTCGPYIINVDVSDNPSCNICYDGSIYVQASGASGNPNLRYSIDGGLTFSASPNFDGLTSGEYEIVVKNIISGCLATKTVFLVAPVGTNITCCDNGGFELGDFTNWTGGLGTNEILPIGNSDLGTTSMGSCTCGANNCARHAILSGNIVDPVVPNLQISTPTNGTYIARLGNCLPGLQMEKLTYNLIVDECNSNFFFNYLIVMEEPHSDESENPFFRWVVTNVTTSEQIVDHKIKANTDNDIFEVFESGSGTNIVYTSWRCESIDLLSKASIGDNIRIDFYNADCIRGCHFGYTYIDGLCNDLELSSPHAKLNVNEAYCANLDVLVDATESYSYLEYKWTVCAINDIGEEENCKSNNSFTKGSITGQFNVTDFYESKGGEFVCDKTYRVKLALKNDCTEPVTVYKDFLYNCAGLVELNYNDIINCLGEDADVTIEGTNQSENCIFSWTPSQYLDDANLEFPTILGSMNVNALDKTYIVEAVNDLGCHDKDTVTIYNFSTDINFKPKLISYCGYELVANLTISSGTPISSGLIHAVFTNQSTGDEYAGELVETPVSGFSFTFTAIDLQDPAHPKKVEVPTTSDDLWMVEFIISTDPNAQHTSVIGDCKTFAQYLFVPHNIYYGNFGEFVIDNVMTKNGDGINDVACFDSNYPPIYQHNAYYAKLVIVNQWGDEVFEREAFGDMENFIPFPDSDLCWDGTHNGDNVPAGTYWWLLYFKNCDHPEEVFMGTDFMTVKY